MPANIARSLELGEPYSASLNEDRRAKLQDIIITAPANTAKAAPMIKTAHQKIFRDLFLDSSVGAEAKAW